jgi:hypothetical protein
MQPCNRIYYSKFIEESTCFEPHTAHHQELQTVFAVSGLYTHVVTGLCPGWVGTLIKVEQRSSYIKRIKVTKSTTSSLIITSKR